MKLLGIEIGKKSEMNDYDEMFLKIENVKKSHNTLHSNSWKETGEMFEMVRFWLGISQTKAASEISIARSTLSNFENGFGVQRAGLIQTAYEMFLELYMRDYEGFSGPDIIRLNHLEKWLLLKKDELSRRKVDFLLEIEELDNEAGELDSYSPEYRMIERGFDDLFCYEDDILNQIKTCDTLIRIITIGLTKADIERKQTVDKNRDFVLAAHNL